MMILHLSDIHFRYPICTKEYDPDKPFRTLLMQDSSRKAQQLGPVNAILITGDISYCGSPTEYSFAHNWLIELAKKTGCPPEQIFMVPGNHDVDQSIIKKNPNIRISQQAITTSSERRREKEFFELLQNEDIGRALFEPLKSYNEFAAKFNCQIYSPDRLFWRQDLALDESTTLRIHGLTSTILSGAKLHEGIEDQPTSLYLSPYQTAIDPVDGIVNLVMSHHPPDWFMDQSEIEDNICERAVLHLFGHKHRQRYIFEERYARFAAGAVNPDRHELGWEPGYNLIELSTIQENFRKYLKIVAHLRVLQKSPEQFTPKMSRQNTPFFECKIPIGNISETQKWQYAPLDDGEKLSDLTPENLKKELLQKEDRHMKDEIIRNLVYRFFCLPSSQRREISFRLGLISELEMALPEPERYGRALVQAREKDLLLQVSDEIKKAEEMLHE